MPHRSREELLTGLHGLQVEAGQRYQHYRTGGVYTIVSVGYTEIDEQLAVIYCDELEVHHFLFLPIRLYSFNSYEIFEKWQFF